MPEEKKLRNYIFLLLASITLLIMFGVVIHWTVKNQTNALLIRKYFIRHPEAERASLQSLAELKSGLAVLRKSQSKEIDLRDSVVIASYKADPEYKNFDYIFTAELINDSVIIIDDYDPRMQKLEADGKLVGMPSYETEYLFHKNGDVEIIIGNYLFAKSSRMIGIELYINGQTGGFVNFSKNENNDNSFQLQSNGEMKVGAHYEPQLASNMFLLGYLRFEKLLKKVK